MAIDAGTDGGVAFASLDVFSHSLQVDEVAGTQRLFIADGFSDAIPVYDVTDPRVPVPLATVLLEDPAPAFGGVHDLFVDGTMIYANESNAGLVALDVSAGLDAAVHVARFQTETEPYSHASWAGTAGGRRVVLDGDEGGLGTTDGSAFLRVLDGDPASPGFLTQIGRYQSRREVSLHYFELVGDRAYVAYFHDGLRVVDLSDPENPVEVAHANTWNDDTSYVDQLSGAFAVRVVDGLIYIADSTSGLVILREL